MALISSVNRPATTSRRKVLATTLMYAASVTTRSASAAGSYMKAAALPTVEMVGDVAKKTKQEINTVWIYPPKAERAAALASADPERVTAL